MFFDVDLDVLPVGFGGIDFVYSSLCPEDSYRRDPTADAGDAEHCREEYCKQFPQNIDQKTKSNQQQTYDEKSCRKVSRCLRNCVRVKTKAHVSYLVVRKERKAGPDKGTRSVQSSNTFRRQEVRAAFPSFRESH